MNMFFRLLKKASIEREMREQSILQQAEAYARHIVSVELERLVENVSETTHQMDRRLREVRAEVLAGNNRYGALIDHFAAFGKRLDLSDGMFVFLNESLRRASVDAALTEFGPVFVIKGDLVGDTLIETGQWDGHLYQPIEAAAKRGGACVDVGAQFGIHSSLLSTKFETVYSFEPNVVSFRVLALNAFFRPNIRPFNLALYDEPGLHSLSVMSEQDVAFDIDENRMEMERSGNVGSVSFSPKGSSLNMVQAVTLDSLALQNVAFMKIDAQGADGRVMMGARETIARCRPVICFEWETHLAKNHGIELDEMLMVLKKLNYNVNVLREHNGKQRDFIAIPN